MRLISGVVAALCTVVVPAMSASATPSGRCAGGRVCLYAGSDYNRGTEDYWRDFVADDSDLSDDTWLDRDHGGTRHSIADETSSFRNRIGCGTTLWQHPYFTGAHSTFIATESDDYFADDSVSSVDIWCR
ncbi:peptidase inhibitor family I36 protein [Nonomuraea sp. NPDC050022]|uniref:peptidase inhibitor family I36 protein n=1 Tax=unclassified Nonomuraea TaxID=2593643 RepID=UPI0033EE5BA9